MFTILPSLYFLGVHYFQQWKAPYYYEQLEKQESITNICPIENKKVKQTRRKKLNGLRRKTSISELNHDDIVHLIDKTGFTREEIVGRYDDFLHDCPDGKLSKIQFINIYQQFYKKGRVTKFCEHAFRLFNKDGSGYLDFMEFILAVSLISSKDRIRKIELFFSMFDIDNNGSIDESEMRSFIESIYELMGIDISDPSRIDSKVYELFSKAECDQLGCLRKDQFAVACENDRHIRKLLMSNTKSSDDQEN